MPSPALEKNLIERIALGDMLRRRSRDSGNQTAIVGYNEHGRSTITYQQLNQLSNQLVRGLREQGLKQGDSLALLATNSIEFFAVLFACYKGGFVAVPVNFLQAVGDIHYNLSKANVKAVVCEPRFAPP
ncbi:AMP-binding protein [Endozoicomonas montiporae]|uniref:AMP-binding protein n=1 Tax=Endozoicomonas montiporae TaxID=1027273 RepID=UPI0006900690|nr:AMP-binding protein [Endozoicomonas montiporae]